VISPAARRLRRNKGKISFATTGISLHSFVFGNERLQLDFNPLNEAITTVLNEMKEKVRLHKESWMCTLADYTTP
jgi:hypothetical protein